MGEYSIHTDMGAAMRALHGACRMEEAAAVAALRGRIAMDPATRERTDARAQELARAVRRSAGEGGAEAFLRTYGLSTREGVVLMCLAEALLRIPDPATVDALLHDKLAGTHWQRPLADEGLLVNAASWGLMLTGRLAAWSEATGDDPQTVVKRLVARLGEPLARAAVPAAMGILARQFVSGETIDDALEAAAQAEARGYRHSYDMLGEAAHTAADAERYCAAYADAIEAVGRASNGRGPLAGPGISVKLSALHPRYEVAQKRRVAGELFARLLELAQQAKAVDIGLTIDAEESDRLLLALELFERLARAPALTGWDGLGMAVQAYQKQAIHVVDWLLLLGRETGRRLTVRLVKGAYWDTEIKLAQVRGLDYPVFTRKTATDLSYLACAQALLAARDDVHCAFATHNCRAVAGILELAGRRRNFEFQKLQGMGDALYRQVAEGEGIPCRIYAPVGSHRDLLPYLVRRLLENGANNSFVHQIVDPAVPLEQLVADPLRLIPEPYTPNPRTPPPVQLLPWRGAASLDLADERVLARLSEAVAAARRRAPVPERGAQAVQEPADTRRTVGFVRESAPAEVAAAVGTAAAAFPAWSATPAAQRARCLERAAEILEARLTELLTLAVREAGKSLPDALGEVREAIDYCRYYAHQGRRLFAAPAPLPGPTGEANTLALAGRGVFACLSPWNFPLAIFLGQVTAALAAGNTVVAKPAEQTPLIAREAVNILHEAGVPKEALHLLLGAGETVGAALVGQPGLAGVAFTGSLETARAIQRALAFRDGPLVPLIAETGGQNAMIVDSSALPEQVVRDAVASAFQSAGQRCSALRLLVLQEEIAERIETLLAGAMRELIIGDPAAPETDIGPVIDGAARAALQDYVTRLRARARPIAELTVPPELEHGHYVAPVAFGIDVGEIPHREVFGPVLHVIRYRASELEGVLDAIQATGYGLTLGIESRIDRFVDRVRRRLRAGNIYVNRNMIGAVVGVQPFGGEGLSGTGPKAGGPHTLLRYAVERTLSVNTAAAGGNARLLSEPE